MINFLNGGIKVKVELGTGSWELRTGSWELGAERNKKNKES